MLAVSATLAWTLPDVPEEPNQEKPLLCPVVSLVVVVRVAQEQAALRPVNNEPNVGVLPHRPRVLVLRPVQLMKTHPWTCRIQLQVERRGFDGFLLFAGQPGKAAREGVDDAEVNTIPKD